MINNKINGNKYSYSSLLSINWRINAWTEIDVNIFEDFTKNLFINSINWKTV